MSIVDRITQAIHDVQRVRKGSFGPGAVIHLGQREWCELRANKDTAMFLVFDQQSCPRFMGIVVRLRSVESLLEVTP